eukprot:08586.XXX_118830_119315_1 [CDS] Oithona nana genome sequencing.
MRLTPLLRVYWSVPKGPKAPLYRKFKYFNMATPEKYGGSLFKNLMAEAPELLTSTVLVIISAGMLTYVAIRDEYTGGTKNKPYKEDLMIIRPDDPLIEIVKVRKAYYEDPMNPPSPIGVPFREPAPEVKPFGEFKAKEAEVYDGSKPYQTVTKRDSVSRSC